MVTTPGKVNDDIKTFTNVTLSESVYSFGTLSEIGNSKGAVTYHRIALTDAEWKEKIQKMFIRW